MAGPLSGVGGQQIPLSTTYQPGQGLSSARRDESQQAKQNKIQPVGGETGQAQKADTQNQRQTSSQGSALSAPRENLLEQASNRRGSLLDVTV